MENLQKEFVPFELAFRMKQLGFDEPCITFYPVNLTQPLIGDYATLGLNGKYSSIKDGYRNSVCLNQLWKKRYKQDYANVAAPTYSQAFRFFREKYNLKGHVEPVEYLDGTPDTYHWSIFNNCNSGNDQLTHEEAELACLEKLIEIVEEYGKDNNES
jgi:hypothetical protein